MGTTHHHAILATTWSPDHVKALRTWVAGREEWEYRVLFGPAMMNNQTTVVVVPDGGKEGLDESQAGEDFREAFIERLAADDYDDGSSPWMYVEVEYGELGIGVRGRW